MSGERHPSLHATALATGSGGFLLPATIADQGGKASKRILSSGYELRDWPWEVV